MAIHEEVQQAMAEAQKRVPRALTALKQHYAVTNEQIAETMGLPDPTQGGRNWVQARVHGPTRCSMSDLAGFAVAFGVTIEMLYQEPATVIRWVLDHPTRTPAWLAALRLTWTVGRAA